MDNSIEEAGKLVLNNRMPGEKLMDVMWLLALLGIACLNRDPRFRTYMDEGKEDSVVNILTVLQDFVSQLAGN